MVFVALIIWVTSVASAQDPAKALYVAEDSYLRWRLLPAEQEYLSIDGKHLKQYVDRSEEHTSELQSQFHLVCRLLLEKKKNQKQWKTLQAIPPSNTVTI